MPNDAAAEAHGLIEADNGPGALLRFLAAFQAAADDATVSVYGGRDLERGARVVVLEVGGVTAGVPAAMAARLADLLRSHAEANAERCGCRRCRAALRAWCDLADAVQAAGASGASDAARLH